MISSACSSRSSPSSRSLKPGDARQEPHQELPADHRGQLHRAFAVLAETVQAGHDDALDGVGHAHLAETFHEAVAAVLPPEDAQIEEGLGHLLDEQRHALGLLHEGGLEFCGELRCPEDAARHGQRLGLGEAVERQRGVKAATPKRRRVADPVGEQEQQRHARHGVQQRA